MDTRERVAQTRGVCDPPVRSTPGVAYRLIERHPVSSPRAVVFGANQTCVFARNQNEHASLGAVRAAARNCTSLHDLQISLSADRIVIDPPCRSVKQTANS